MIRIIPCLDVARGRVVKGVNFTDLQDIGDPVAKAVEYAAQGADELVLLDILATTEGRQTFIDLVRQVAAACPIPFAVGGGIRSIDDIRAILKAGAAKVGINSAAVARPELISEAVAEFGSACIVSAIDGTQTGSKQWQVVTHGGKKIHDISIVDWAKDVAARGAAEILLTSLDTDGKKTGYDCGLTAAVADAVDIPVISSGGGGTLQDMLESVTIGHAQAVLAASIFHYGIHTVAEVKQYFAAHGLEVSAQP